MTIVEHPIDLVLVGSNGRMGTALVDACNDGHTHRVVGRVDIDGEVLPSETTNSVVIDFSSDAGTQRAIIIAEKLKSPILVGTTALKEATIDRLRLLARSLPVAVVPNTSLGIALLQHFVSIAIGTGDDQRGLDAVLREVHHACKRDAPSGTAIDLVKSMNQMGLEVSCDDVESIRTGDVVGTHEVRLDFGDERLVLRHEALDRSLFARGALRLAGLLIGRAPGLYRASDLLDLDLPARKRT